MTSYDQTRKAVSTELKAQGFSISRDAMAPLKRIDFAKLVAIHDHEEHFLRTVFLSSLVTLSRARPAATAGPNTITADDVEVALRMLGTAAARQGEQTLSTATRKRIKNACPYC